MFAKSRQVAGGKVLRIAFDIEGTDRGWEEICRGLLVAAKKFRGRVVLVAVGLKEHVDWVTRRDGSVEGVYADTVFPMDGKIESTRWDKSTHSVAVANQLVKDGKADVALCPGNSAAATAAATLIHGRIAGVERAAIFTRFPILTDFFSGAQGEGMIGDVGSQVDCSPRRLGQIAVLGACFAKASGIESPRVAVLNIGDEPGKGPAAVAAAYSILSYASVTAHMLDFIGSVEGDTAFHGLADVVVADGAAGNIWIKTAEQTLRFFNSIFKPWWMRILCLPILPVLIILKHRLNPRKYSTAPFVGLKGFCCISHGKIDSRDVVRAIEQVLSYAPVVGTLQSAIADQIAAFNAICTEWERAEELRAGVK